MTKLYFVGDPSSGGPYSIETNAAPYCDPKICAKLFEISAAIVDAGYPGVRETFPIDVGKGAAIYHWRIDANSPEARVLAAVKALCYAGIEPPPPREVLRIIARHYREEGRTPPAKGKP